MRESQVRLIGRGIVIGLCALACFVALSLHTERVAAAGYTVNVTTDTGAGSGTTGDLRYAINQVNAGAGTGDTITITATGAITMRSGPLPALAKPVAITGPGAAMLTVQAATVPHSAIYGVFTVNSGVTASISNLTIANGNSDAAGGGINNAGTLTVTNSTLSSNSTRTFGGGIENTATLTVTNSTFSGNSTNGMHGDIVNPMPNLGPLASNGGPTQTRALLTGSPAIGAGDSSVCNSTTTPPGAPVGGKDQRGVSRPAMTCAIGAFEPQTITLAPTTLPNATLGVPYSQTITASGGTGPYTFAVTMGALPPGLTLATNGTVSGKPTGAGSFTFTVTATDHGGATGSRAYTLVVPAPKPLPAPRPGGGTGGGPPHALPPSRPGGSGGGMPKPVPLPRP